MEGSKKAILKIQDDILKNAFQAYFLKDQALPTESVNMTFLESVYSEIMQNSITWIIDQPRILDAILFDLMVFKKEDFFSTLINAHANLKHELTKQSNIKFPKIKQFLEDLLKSTMNYGKLMFIDKDILSQCINSNDSFSMILAKLLYKHTVKNGYPTDFIKDFRQNIEKSVYDAWIKQFYQILFQNLNNVFF